jgi:hypothetical protein
MKLERLVHQVEARLFRWLGEVGKEEPVEERELILADMQRTQEERARLTARRAELAARVEESSQAAALLPSQIENSLHRGKTSQAMVQALELERLRRGLSDDRAELARIEQALWSHDFRLRQLRRGLARVPANKKGPR